MYVRPYLQIGGVRRFLLLSWGLTAQVVAARSLPPEVDSVADSWSDFPPSQVEIFNRREEKIILMAFFI